MRRKSEIIPVWASKVSSSQGMRLSYVYEDIYKTTKRTQGDDWLIQFIEGSRLSSYLKALISDRLAYYSAIHSMADIYDGCRLAKSTAEAGFPDDMDWARFEKACSASMRFELEDILEEAREAARKVPGRVAFDSEVIASWRLEYNVGVPLPYTSNADSRALDTFLSVADLEKLVLSYETEAGTTLTSLSTPGHFDNSAYHRAGSHLFWGILKAKKEVKDGVPLSLNRLLYLSRVPEDLQYPYPNSDSGIEWLVEALSAEKPEDLDDYLILDWDDRCDYGHEGSRHLALATAKHPMRPDSYIVARWRLENGIGF